MKKAFQLFQPDPERIQKIQSELPAHTETENERAFTEAAEEYYREQHMPVRRNSRKRLFCVWLL